jgi:hypothetical protein
MDITGGGGGDSPDSNSRFCFSDEIGFIMYEHRSSVADPHHLDADPDPTYYLYADPDPDFYLMRIRIQVPKMIRIRIHNTAQKAKLTTHSFDSSLNAFCIRVIRQLYSLSNA